MNLMISRCLALFGALLVAVPAPTWAAVSEAYQKGWARYEEGDYTATVAALKATARRDADDELLLGLAQLRLDDPVRAGEAWGQFVRTTPDRRLASDVARFRTLLVREGNRRAAQEALRAEKSGRLRVADDVLAVFPFRNVGEAKYEPLGKAIAAMLASSLSAVPTSRLIGRGRVQAFLQAADDGGGDTQVARRVGRLLGAGLVVVGAHVDTSSDPPTLEVHSAVIDTSTGERVESGSFLAPLDRFYVAVRDTAVALAGRLEWPVSALPAANAKRVQAIQTESLDAALAFGRGLESEDRGDYPQARREFERAVRADGSFQLARDRLATLPAASISLPAIAAAVQSELPEVAPPVVVADVVAELEPEPETTPSPALVAEATVVAPVAVPPVRVAAPAEPAPESDGAAGADEDEETTILGMSPMTAALVGGGLALAIGAGAAAAGGGGGGGGDDGGGGNTPRPPTLTGVQDRSVNAGELIVLNIEGQDPEGSTVTLSESGAPSSATFDTSSGNPATGTFRWQTTSSDRGQTVDVTFTAVASRGPPNDSTSETATLSVLAAPPTPTPPPTCGGTGASCTAAAECCQDIPRECDVTPAGGGTRCCLGLTTACQIDGDCCGSANACDGGRCCAPLGVSCSDTSDCCDDAATCGAGTCCLPDGLSCADDGDCCTGRCASGVCEGVAPPTPSPSPTPPMCVPQGDACDAVFECCPGSDCDETPTSTQSICCAPLGAICNDESICCGVTMGCDDVCCRPVRSACADASECCGDGAGCVLGRCCSAPGGSCSIDSDCCAGSCAGGTCSAALSADARPTPTPRPRPTSTPTATPSPTPTGGLFF